MFDGTLDTCWNSNSGDYQFILFDFSRIVIPRLLKVTFQGGFAGNIGKVEVGTAVNDWQRFYNIEGIRDSNEIQEFLFEPSTAVTGIRYLKLTFEGSSDFYGRMIIYNLEIFGNET